MKPPARSDLFWTSLAVRGVITTLAAATACAPSAAPVDAPSSKIEPLLRRSNDQASMAPQAAASPSSSSSRPEPLTKKLVVHVLPLGPVPDETLKSLVAGLEAHADIQARLHPVIPLANARKAKRPGRYLAHDMLELLARAPDTEGGKVLGVTEVDIVAEKDGNPEWGVLGLGSIDGKSCVLSTFRMRRAWDHGGADEPTVRSRLWKTAVHEVGHTLGLEHCPTKGCVMEDGHGTVATTDNETDLCPSCATRYKRAIGSGGL